MAASVRYIMGMALLSFLNGAGSLATGSLDTSVTREPYLIDLRRESVPVKRKGKVVSFKTSYSGTLSIGGPERQDFRVLFDTGSGHVVLPSKACKSETCLGHHQYDISLSEIGARMKVDGSAVHGNALSDEITIVYGSGKVSGELVREKVCLNAFIPDGNMTNSSAASTSSSTDLCVVVDVVMATEMSENPFGLFPFDGVLGLGLSDLALNRNCSFLHIMSQSNQLEVSQFAFFLTSGEEGEVSELALGGYNPHRLLTPEISWAPVARPGFGHWQVRVVAIHVGDVTLDFCREGSCHGVIDTGTSHLGVPAPYDQQVAELTTTTAGDLQDCRFAEAPPIKIELEGFNLTLTADNYMRRLPLREDVQVGSGASSFWRPTEASNNETGMQKFCRPRLMPVRMPAPIGPNVFIFGEPVLHTYYTIFDFTPPRVGFGLAASSKQKPEEATSRVG